MATAARGNSSQIAFCPTCENNFPMIEWHLISPSPYFWKLNVDLTFVDETLSKLNKNNNNNNNDNNSNSNIEKFVLVTFQSQTADLAPLAKKRMEREETEIKQQQQQKQKQVEGESTHDEVNKKVEEKPKSEQQNKEEKKGDEKSTISGGGEGAYMYSEAVTEWKDLCRENVLAMAELILERLQKLTSSSNTDSSSSSSSVFWFDSTDPATGVPMNSTAGPSLFCESDAIEQVLKMPIVTVGVGNSVCRLVQHPKYGLDVYPTSMFYVGPRELLLEALKGL